VLHTASMGLGGALVDEQMTDNAKTVRPICF